MAKSEKVIGRWFAFYTALLSKPLDQRFFSWATIVSIAFNTAWLVWSAAGQDGSPAFLAIAGIASLLYAGALFLFAKFFRWPILFFVVKRYILLKMIPEGAFKNKILVSCGPGGALAVGLVSKALQKLGCETPLSIIVDAEYLKNGHVEMCKLLPYGFSLEGKDCLIVHSYSGTGKSLEQLRTRLRIPNAKVFSFIISRDLELRNSINYYIHVGDRGAIPWPQSEAKEVSD